jgi:hypothetical protein
MNTITLTDDEISFLKEKFSGIYQQLFPYLVGNEFKFPNEEAIRRIAYDVNDAIIDEYDDKKDDMSMDGIRLEDIWSLF